MNRCQDFEVAISLRSADALDAAETAELEAHLASCASCRAEAARADEVVSLARLPPVAEVERRALRDLPARTLDALHASERRIGLGKRVVAGALAAAAAAAVVLAPAVLRKEPTAPPPDEVALAQAEPAWESPDLDGLWEDARLVDFESADTASDGTDAAVAALDF